ncbi:putative quinol monooxygenase [Bacillus thuringiensis]|uniref:putative quinol monooxygenase n=1 Tax=Bacillus cereus group TaxID=86661 RepID=UPI0032FB6859|nr:antibiotic biosynthesis monooxygenase [Bacillus cereus]HDR8117886.1 antibiotic biosynthesis monooxygenase [Bacillus cereus]
MIKVGLLAQFEIKPGKKAEVETFLKEALTIVNSEKETVTWYAVQLSPSIFGIFDTFQDEEGRELHLSGKVAEALMEKSTDLFISSPSIQKIEILASKISGK